MADDFGDVGFEGATAVEVTPQWVSVYDDVGDVIFHAEAIDPGETDTTVTVTWHPDGTLTLSGDDGG